MKWAHSHDFVLRRPVMSSPYGAQPNPMVFSLHYALTPLSYSWLVVHPFIGINRSLTPLASRFVNILNVSVWIQSSTCFCQRVCPLTNPISDAKKKELTIVWVKPYTVSCKTRERMQGSRKEKQSKVVRRRWAVTLALYLLVSALPTRARRPAGTLYYII